MFNSRSLSAHIKHMQGQLLIDFARDSMARRDDEVMLETQADELVADSLREALKTPHAPLAQFDVEPSGTSPAFSPAVARASYTQEAISAADEYARISFFDEGMSLEEAARPVRNSEKIRDDAQGFLSDLERLHQPFARVNEKLAEMGKEELDIHSFREYYGGFVNPARYAVDKGYREVRKAMVEVYRNYELAARRQAPFQDIQMGKHASRAWMTPSLDAKSILNNLEGIGQAKRLISKANSKIEGDGFQLEMVELRQRAESLDQVDEKVVADGVERLRDPLALEQVAVARGDPQLAKAVLNRVKAAALDNLDRSLFDHSMHARDLALEDTGFGRRRGQARQYRSVDERNRQLIGYQIQDNLLLRTAEQIRAVINEVTEPAGATLAANKAMIIKRLADDDRLDPTVTAKLLDQFTDNPAAAQDPLPAQAVADTARLLGYGQDEARLALLVKDQTSDALPARPRVLEPGQPVPKPRRLA